MLTLFFPEIHAKKSLQLWNALKFKGLKPPLELALDTLDRRVRKYCNVEKVTDWGMTKREVGNEMVILIP